MEAFLYATDKAEVTPKNFILINSHHISEVRPTGSQMDDGAEIVMSTGRRIITVETFAKIVEKLLG
jgi:hypothetical protein